MLGIVTEEQRRKARSLIENPETFESLPQRCIEDRAFLLWQIPAFDIWSSWSAFQDENTRVSGEYWLRRVQWNPSKELPSHVAPPTAIASEAILPKRVLNGVLMGLSIQLPEHFFPDPLYLDPSEVCVEVKSERHHLRYHFVPQGSPSTMQNWLTETIQTLDAFLPESTVLRPDWRDFSG
ncbi:MAG: hypothetical protein H6727_20930 [Myxococcales bacterium]|nr:hypothetical protein [Myxococcales bacterium]